jgi:hypothetical protein
MINDFSMRKYVKDKKKMIQNKISNCIKFLYFIK